MWKKFLTFSPVLLMAAGCTTTEPDTIARLSPSEEPRNPTGQYFVETSFTTTQQSLIPDSVKASIIVGGKIIPMTPLPIVNNRWEGYIPVPAGQNSVDYRFVFDYEYNSFGKGPTPDTKTSKPYTLKIAD